MRRLLVVDDDPMILAAMEAGMSSPLWRIETAAEAMSAFVKARDLRPFLIISDVQMPTYGKGTDMVRALRRDKATADIPVIVVTGMDLERARAMLGGEDPLVRLLGKPPDFDQLFALVKELTGVDAGAAEGA